MEVAIVLGASLRYCPYALPYIKLLLDSEHKITLFVWTRDKQEDLIIDDRVRIERYSREIDDLISKGKKIPAFLGFKKHIIKQLESYNYHFVVVFDTQFAVLLSHILLKKYRRKFIFDMRDMSYEHIWLYRKRVKRLVDVASAVIISSDGYRKYLPESSSIFTTHNIMIDDLKQKGLRAKTSRNHSTIRISFWGMIRDIDLNIQLIDLLKNDGRFFLNFHGPLNNNTSRLIEYCEERKIDNVKFHGIYLPSERYDFVANTDLIHNLYLNPKYGSNPAMGNKYYDGVIFQIPQICMMGGFMGSLVEKNDIGIVVDLRKDLGDILYDYYAGIDWNGFEKNCELELDRIISEFQQTSDIIQNCFDGVSCDL